MSELLEKVVQALLAADLQRSSEIAGRPVEADEFATMVAYENARAALAVINSENKVLVPREATAEMLAAWKWMDESFTYGKGETLAQRTWREMCLAAIGRLDERASVYLEKSND